MDKDMDEDEEINPFFEETDNKVFNDFKNQFSADTMTSYRVNFPTKTKSKTVKNFILKDDINLI